MNLHPWRTVLGAALVAWALCLGARASGAQPLGPAPPPKAEEEDLMRLTARLNAQIAAQEEIEARMQLMRERGSVVPVAARRRLELAIRAEQRRTDLAAGTERGEARVAERLSREFGMTRGELRAQKEESGQGWGDVVMSHTLAANSGGLMSSNNLLEMHAQGTSWSHIAAGLGLSFKDVRAAVRAEARVALGLERPDARIASIHAAPVHGPTGREGSDAGAGLEGPLRADAGTQGSGSFGLPSGR